MIYNDFPRVLKNLLVNQLVSNVHRLFSEAVFSLWIGQDPVWDSKVRCHVDLP